MNAQPKTALRDFLKAMPKAELHLHIEGGLPFELLQAACPQEFPSSPPYWDAAFKFENFAAFDAALMSMAFAYFKEPADYVKPARLQFERHLENGVRYVEVSFASAVMEFLGFDGEAVLQAIHSAKPEGLELRIFLGIHHNGFGGAMLRKIEAALEWELLAGFDLHGDESVPVDSAAPRIWEQARAAGKFTKAHAGEFGDTKLLRFAMEELGAQRIEHGIAAAKDKGLMRELQQRKLCLDVCPISNAKLAPEIHLHNHPARELFDAGVALSVNTDDPLIFGNTLLDDYAALATHRDFKPKELVQLARYGLQAALVEPSVRDGWLRELASFEQTFCGCV